MVTVTQKAGELAGSKFFGFEQLESLYTALAVGLGSGGEIVKKSFALWVKNCDLEAGWTGLHL